jgi:hypothetical protein
MRFSTGTSPSRAWEGVENPHADGDEVVEQFIDIAAGMDEDRFPGLSDHYIHPLQTWKNKLLPQVVTHE